MGITRRHVLAAMAGMTAAGAVGVGVTGMRWWDRPAGDGRIVLSEGEHGFVQALAEAWMPPGGEPSISGSEARVGDFVDEVIAHMQPTQAKLLRVLLHALDEETVPTHLARYQTLPLETRSEVLRGWMDSSWYLQRQAVSAVLALVSFGYTLHPEVSRIFSPLFGCGYGR